MNILIPNENPWQVELDGTTRLNELGYRVFGTKEKPYSYTNALNNAHPGINLEGMSEETIAQMVEFGWLKVEE